jgi:hypothetical protein
LSLFLNLATLVTLAGMGGGEFLIIGIHDVSLRFATA